MNYKIGVIGYGFLKSMKVDFGWDFIKPGAIFESFSTEEQKKFKNSIFYSGFYSQTAGEIMKKIFTSVEQEKLQRLIAELKNEEVSLITRASSEVDKIKKEHESSSVPLRELTADITGDELEKMIKGVVVKVFEEIPSYALNLLGLIKVKKENFPQSYNLFERMLGELNQEKHYDQEDIKKHFSKALDELENLVKSVKNKKKPDETKKEETANLGEENVKNETPPEQTPLTRTSRKGIKMSLLTQRKNQKGKIIQKITRIPINPIILTLLTWRTYKLSKPKLFLILLLPSTKILH